MLVVFEQRSDVRVRQIGGIMGFGTQAAQLGLGVGHVRAQRLDGHFTSELNIVAFPDLAHTALRKTRIKTISAVNKLSFDKFHCCKAPASSRA